MESSSDRRTSNTTRFFVIWKTLASWPAYYHLKPVRLNNPIYKERV